MSFLPSGVATLLSDFGLEDPSVGILKGAMLSRFAQILIVDLCHAVPQKDVLWATYALAGSYRDFPPGTVHCAIVAPGRGGPNGVLVAERAGHVFVAPDNGLLSKVLGEKETRAWRVDLERVPVAPIRRSFHTRDVVVSIGALLASGKLGLEDVGDPTTEFVHIDSLRLTVGDQQVEGVMLGEDRFGNLFASISDSDLPSADKDLVVEFAGKVLPIVGAIHEAEAGKAVAMFNYFGMLEIVLRDGKASESIDWERGAPIRVCWQ